MTFDEIEKMVSGKGLPICGKNEDDENVLIEKGDGCYKLTTAQHNGWTRINLYHRDGSIEEMYER